MRPYLLAESHWGAVKDIPLDLVILPWGAIEAHNFHLPYGTDMYQSEALAAEAARIAHEQGARLMVLPTLPYGVNTGQADSTLDMNLRPSTLLTILDDLVATLDRQGYRKLLILNSHGGNDFKPILRELGLKYPKMLLLLTNWFSAVDKTAYFQEGGDHADEMETALMLHIQPELVRPLNEAGPGKENPLRLARKHPGWVWTERRWSQATNDTGVGDPRKATAESGARFFKDVTRTLAEVFMEIAAADPDELYEKSR